MVTETRQVARRPCERLACMCDHVRCDGGWIDLDERGSATKPCPECRPELRKVLNTSVPPQVKRAEWARRRGWRLTEG